jgi:L-xylulokinase
MAPCLLGIDSGNTMTKAALFGLDGTELGCERRRNPIQFPGAGFNERDPNQWWDDAAEAIRILLERTATPPKDIIAISVSGYGGGLYLVDGDGMPVRPGIMSTDSRAVRLIERWRSTGQYERNARRIQQRIWPGQSVALLGWLTEHEPELLGRTQSVLFCKDFLRMRLCGDRSTDATDAGIAGVIDVRRGSYAEDMLNDLGLSSWLAKLPPIGGPAEVVGSVTREAARQTGLAAGTPVVRGLADVTASALGTDVRNPDQLSVVAGTFSINSTLHAQPRMSSLPFLQTAYPLGPYYFATEGSATSASSLEWFCKSLLRAETAQAAATGRSIYDICNELVAGAQGRPNDILFFPFIFGGPNGAPAGLVGLSAAHDLGDVLSAIYECIAFAHKADIAPLLTGPDAARPTSIRLTGGAARSPVWSQIFADVLELPVEVCESGESGALGVAMCAAAAVDTQGDLAATVTRMSRVAGRFMPREERSAVHRKKFARYGESVAGLAIQARAAAA